MKPVKSICICFASFAFWGVSQAQEVNQSVLAPMKAAPYDKSKEVVNPSTDNGQTGINSPQKNEVVTPATKDTLNSYINDKRRFQITGTK